MAMLSDDQATVALSLAAAIDMTLALDDANAFDQAASEVLNATRSLLWELLLPDLPPSIIDVGGGSA